MKPTLTSIDQTNTFYQRDSSRIVPSRKQAEFCGGLLFLTVNCLVSCFCSKALFTETDYLQHLVPELQRVYNECFSSEDQKLCYGTFLTPGTLHLYVLGMVYG